MRCEGDNELQVLSEGRERGGRETVNYPQRGNISLQQGNLARTQENFRRYAGGGLPNLSRPFTEWSAVLQQI